MVRHQSRDGMNNQTGQIIAKRIHSPDNIIQAICHPGQRHAGTQITRGKHPVDLVPAQAAIIRVGQEKRLIIPTALAVALRLSRCDLFFRSRFPRHT